MHRLTAYATKEGTTEAQANSLCYRGNRHRLTAYATEESTGNQQPMLQLKGEFYYEQT